MPQQPIITIESCPSCELVVHGTVGRLLSGKFCLLCHNKIKFGWECLAHIQLGDPRIPVKITVACESCGSDVTGIPVTTPDGAHLLITCPKCGKEIRLY